ncbi:MAG: glycosyl hydrolase family 39, partial [Acidobacteriota bacterium]|nr:glycosyl hydrolase family 39 [Acidobacteriota bacterium]
NKPGDDVPPPAAYWNLAGSLYAYLFVELSQMGIDVIGESQLIGYPTQFPSVSMMNWINNQPNARFWVLKLIKDNFHPGDQLVETHVDRQESGEVAAQAFITPQGHKLLLANKRNRPVDILLPDAAHVTALTVDQQSADTPARSVQPADGQIHLEPFAVTVVSW